MPELRVKIGAGEPAAVKLKLYAAPTASVAGGGSEVMAGAEETRFKLTLVTVHEGPE